MKKLLKEKLFTIIFVLFIILVLSISLYYKDSLSLENIKNNKEMLKEIVNENYILSSIIFFLACIIFINSPLPLAAVIKIMGGFLFGFIVGSIYNILATTLACMIGFYLSRYALRNTLHNKFRNHLDSIEHQIEKNGFTYFLTARIILIIPYFLINIIGGLSKIKTKDYFISTILGVIIPSVIYANAGFRLESISKFSDLYSIEMITALFLIASMIIIAKLIANNQNNKKTKNK